MTKNRLFYLTGAVVLTVLMNSCTQNWPQFRGPDNNMVVTGKDLPTEWGDENNVQWTYELEGDSWSSPVVWGKKVFVASVFPVKVAPAPERSRPRPPRENSGSSGGGQNPPPRPPEDKSYLEDVYRWQLACVDLETGAELWKQVAFEGNPRIKKHRAHNYAGETPVTDGKRVYVYFGMTGLFCYDLDGELLWEKDLGAFETLRGWGTGASPALHKNILFVQVDNEEQSFLVALDKVSGEEIWRADRDEATNYSTPMIWKNSIRTELIAGGKKARSYDPETGDINWELSMGGHYNIPSPVADQDMLYLGNAGYRDTPATFFAVKAGAEGDISTEEGESSTSGVAWSILDAPLANPSPLLHNGLLYMISSRGGEISCLDAASGEIVYQEKIEKVAACWASPWAHDDRISFLDEKGVSHVFRAGKEFELLGQNSLDDKFWASVAITKDAYLLKGTEKLYCIKTGGD